MTRREGLVLDANILLRAVFGVRVRALLETYEEEVSFYSPDVCFDDARKYIPEIAGRRRIDPALGLSVLDQVSGIVQSVDRSLYEGYEKVARERVLPRDPEDWPIVSQPCLTTRAAALRTPHRSAYPGSAAEDRVGGTGPQSKVIRWNRLSRLSQFDADSCVVMRSLFVNIEHSAVSNEPSNHRRYRALYRDCAIPKRYSPITTTGSANS
jgi:hypothetical protein